MSFSELLFNLLFFFFSQGLDLGGMLSDYAHMEKRQGKFDDALLTYTNGSEWCNLALVPLRSRTVPSAREVLKDNKDDPYYSNLVGNMASCYKKMDKWCEALGLYSEAVELARATRGNQHPEYATCLFNLGDAYHQIKVIVCCSLHVSLSLCLSPHLSHSFQAI